MKNFPALFLPGFSAAWLEKVMSSGSRILLNSNPFDSYKGSYGMEIETLRSAEYGFVETVVKGIKCWEAVKK